MKEKLKGNDVLTLTRWRWFAARKGMFLVWVRRHGVGVGCDDCGVYSLILLKGGFFRTDWKSRIPP